MDPLAFTFGVILLILVILQILTGKTFAKPKGELFQLKNFWPVWSVPETRLEFIWPVFAQAILALALLFIAFHTK